MQLPSNRIQLFQLPAAPAGSHSPSSAARWQISAAVGAAVEVLPSQGKKVDAG